MSVVLFICADGYMYLWSSSRRKMWKSQHMSSEVSTRFKIQQTTQTNEACIGRVVKVSASQPRDCGFKSHDHVLSYDTSFCWFEEANVRIIYLSCENLFHNRVKINMFKLIKKQITKA